MSGLVWRDGSVEDAQDQACDSECSWQHQAPEPALGVWWQRVCRGVILKLHHSPMHRAQLIAEVVPDHAVPQLRETAMRAFSSLGCNDMAKR